MSDLCNAGTTRHILIHVLQLNVLKHGRVPYAMSSTLKYHLVPYQSTMVLSNDPSPMNHTSTLLARRIYPKYYCLIMQERPGLVVTVTPVIISKDGFIFKGQILNGHTNV